MALLHAHAQYIYIVNAKYQKLQQKLWYKLISLYMRKQNPYLKANRKKNGSFQKAVFLSKKKCFFFLFFFGIKLLYANVQWVYIV